MSKPVWKSERHLRGQCRGCNESFTKKEDNKDQRFCKVCANLWIWDDTVKRKKRTAFVRTARKCNRCGTKLTAARYFNCRECVPPGADNYPVSPASALKRVINGLPPIAAETFE